MHFEEEVVGMLPGGEVVVSEVLHIHLSRATRLPALPEGPRPSAARAYFFATCPLLPSAAVTPSLTLSSAFDIVSRKP